MTASPLPFATPISADFIHGAVEVETTDAGLLPHRLPAWALSQCDDPQLAMAEAQPAGVRIIFDTTATDIELVTLPTKRHYVGMPARPDGCYELLVDGRRLRQAVAPAGNELRINMATGNVEMLAGAPQSIAFLGLDAGSKRVEIWLPHNETTVLLQLRSNAAVFPVASLGQRRWVHHGSSISQGSNATHPTGIWPAIAAAGAGLELLNLGYGGSALLDPFVARAIGTLPADLISIKMGINLVNRDLMRLRAFGPALHGFLDTIRQAHPTVPILLISPIYCAIHETIPGPTMFDTEALREGRLLFRAAGRAEEVAQGKLNLQVIRDQTGAIVAQRQQADRHLHYIDGTSLYGPDDATRHPLPDALHPDADAHRLIGERFAHHLLDAASRQG